MPRKQLDILKDIFVAHRDKNENLYQEKLKEYMNYLRWKGFNKKADEFEKLLNINSGFVKPEIKIEEDLFSVQAAKENLITEPVLIEEEKIPKERKPAWQVASGADANLLKAQQLLSILLANKNKNYAINEFSELLGYSQKKTQGFTRLLYFLGLLQDKTKKTTPLCELILHSDTYFEDPGTLWFLHYYISSQPELIIWNRLTNNLFHKDSFTIEDTSGLFEDQRATHSEYSYNHHLRKEFIVCLNAYTKFEFHKLNLVDLREKEEYIRLKPALLPDDILLAMILLYKSRFYPKQVALEIKVLFEGQNSPGRLTYLNEFRFRDALERLRKSNQITIESFADLDQIKFTTKASYLDVLKNYYENKFGK